MRGEDIRIKARARGCCFQGGESPMTVQLQVKPMGNYCLKTLDRG